MPFRALIDACWKEKYTAARFTRDLIAGITVGIIAIPLAMALAIGSGVAPQYGLYTAAVAGIVIALTGGSRFSVSGPTAAFVVILYPVSQQFGLAGLLVATLLSGIFLILMGLARFGRLIEYIPVSVTLGFTSGIGITIGTMQIKDFLGLQMTHLRFRPGLDPCRRFGHQMQAQTSTPPPRQVEHGGLCRRDAATERIIRITWRKNLAD